MTTDAALAHTPPDDPQQNNTQPTDTTQQPGGKPKQGTTPSGQNPGNGTGQQTTQKATGPTQEDGPQIDVTFGAPRFVTSAGVVGVLLRDQQYQKVQASGQSSGTTIEYSTNSNWRYNALFMGHVRFYQYKGTDDGLFATLGAGGTTQPAAEYFAGATSSFAHNWLFLSIGAYFAKQQTLTGGYKVGSQLPSSFSGSVPTESNYKPGLGIGISIRVPGTATPKTKTPNSNNTTQNKNKNGNTPSGTSTGGTPTS